MDNGETLEVATCRETFEESGIKIDVDQISKHEKSYYVRHGKIDFMFYVFVIELEIKPEIVLRSQEHSEHSWFTPEEALEINLVPDEDIVINNFFFGNSEETLI